MQQVPSAMRQPSTRWALAGLSLTVLMPSLATSTVNVALPSLARTFASSFQATQWIVLVYLLTVTALVVVAGRLGDIVGRRRLLLAGTAVFAGGSLLCGVAPRLELLIVARVVQGSGAAVMMALTVAFVGAVAPTERFGRAMGLLGTMSAVGTTLGPAIGGLLIAWAGSTAIFLINLPLAAAALAIISRTLPQDLPREASPRLDLAGMALLAVSLTGYALSLTLGRGELGFANVAILVVAIVTSTGFVAIEVRAPSPLIQFDLFCNRALISGLSTNLIVSTVMMSTLIVGPFYMARVVGLDPASAGLAMAIGPLVAAVTGVPAGRLVDGFGAGRGTLLGLSAMAAGTVALSLVPAELGIAGYLVPIVLMTAGYGLFQAANNTAVMAGTSPNERGVISGMLNLSRNLGLVTGASAMGSVFVWGANSADIMSATPVAVAAGMHASFAMATILAGVSLIIAFRASRVNQQRRAVENAS